MPTPAEIANAQIQPVAGMPVLEPTDPALESGRVLPTDAPAQPMTEADRQAMGAIPGVDRVALAKMGPATAPVTTAAAEPTQYVSEPKAAVDPFKVVGTIQGPTQTTVSKVDMGEAGKQALGELDAAQKEQIKAQDSLNKIAVDRAAVQAENAKAKVAVADQAQQELAAAFRARHETTDKALQDIRKANDDYDQSVKDLDPNRWWAKQSTGQAIGNLIAIALGGFGAALQARGGNANARNTVMDQINREIDRDIDVQKTALQAKERGISVKQNMYMALRAQGADDIEASMHVAAAGKDRAAAEMEAKTAQLGPGEAQARGQQMSAQLRTQAAEQRVQAAQLTAQRVSSTTSSQPVTAGQMQGAQAADQRKQAGLVEPDPKLQTPLGQATDAESKREIGKFLVAKGQAEQALLKIEVLRKKGGSLGNWTPKDRAIFESARTDLLAYAKGKYGADLGVLSGPDKELIDPQIPSNKAMDTVMGASDALVKNFRDKLEQAKKDMAAGYTSKTHL